MRRMLASRGRDNAITQAFAPGERVTTSAPASTRGRVYEVTGTGGSEWSHGHAYSLTATSSEPVYSNQVSCLHDISETRLLPNELLKLM